MNVLVTETAAPTKLNFFGILLYSTVGGLVTQVTRSKKTLVRRKKEGVLPVLQVILKVFQNRKVIYEESKQTPD